MDTVAYRIETERLVMRCWELEDAAAWRALLDADDQHLRPWIPFMRDEPRSAEDTEAWISSHREDLLAGRNHRYPILTRDGRLIGETGLYTRAGEGALETGYLLASEHCGRGYAREAASAMVRLAFEFHQVDRVEIHCAPENTASARLPEALGFGLEATLRRRLVDSEGALHDGMLWTLFADAYPASHARELPLRVLAADGALLLEV